MQKLTRTDLLSLEQYAEQRPAMRARVLEHKKNRLLQLGPHATAAFEDRLTVQYQIQEMLRIERIFEARGIAEELEAYNPLIPDGSNLKASRTAYGCAWRAKSRCTPSPTRTWTARTTRRLRRCTSCASSSRRP
jgi:hypothetical protein